MEIQKNKKGKIILWIYSILILIYAVFDIIVNILPKILTISIPNTTLINYFFTLTGIHLYITPINIIVGYGLFRRRFWSRYGVIAVMLTFFVYIFSQYLYLWKFCFYQNSVYIQFLFVVLTLFFFTRKRAKALFGESHHFKFISWHALLVVIIILFSFYSIFFSIFMKIKHKLPPHAYAAKPQVIVLKKSNLSETPEKYLKVEILNISLLMPKEFVIRRLFKNHGWKVMFQNKGKVLSGIISLSNEFPYRDEEYIYHRNPFGHISKFDLDKYMRTNNWNPAVVVIRSQQQKIGETIDIKEIHMNGNRGFWERRQQTDEYEFFSGEFTLYKKEEDQFAGGSYVLIKKYFDEKDILTILSSIEFLKSEDPGQSQNHYERGLTLYKRGDTLQAQIEFANAYTLSPENPNYIFMFAKSLFLKETENYDYVKDLLNEVLKLKPDYKDAQRLLKEVGPKLPKETKNLEKR